MSPARVLLNPHRRAELVPPPPGEEVLGFHRALAAYEPTPTWTARWKRQSGRSLWELRAMVKDESNRFGLPAFKILGASWAVARTLHERPDVHTLCAASAGNHGRAVARAAAWRDLRSRIFLPAASAPARAAAIASEGAEVVRVDGSYEDAVAAAEEAGTEPGTANVADTSDDPAARTPGWCSEGYSTLFRELAGQAEQPMSFLIVPIGVGSLAAAAVSFAAHHDPPLPVVGVEPVTAACVTASLQAGEPVTVETPGTTMAGLDCARPSAVAWPVLRDGLFATVTVSDDELVPPLQFFAGVGHELGKCGAAPGAALFALAFDDACAPLREALGYDADIWPALIATEGVTDPDSYHRVV